MYFIRDLETQVCIVAHDIRINNIDFFFFFRRKQEHLCLIFYKQKELKALLCEIKMSQQNVPFTMQYWRHPGGVAMSARRGKVTSCTVLPYSPLALSAGAAPSLSTYCRTAMADSASESDTDGAGSSSATPMSSSASNSGKPSVVISQFRLEELTNRLASLQQENKVLKIELETFKLKCKALQEENRDLRKASVTIVSNVSQLTSYTLFSFNQVCCICQQVSCGWWHLFSGGWSLLTNLGCYVVILLKNEHNSWMFC